MTIGDTAKWRQLAEAFYSRVGVDPKLRHFFPGTTLHCAIEEFTAFLVQIFGGRSEDTQRRWWLSLRESHARFEIGQAERAAWMANMNRALDDVRMEEPWRGALLDFFEESSAYVVNRGEPDSVIRKSAEAHGGAARAFMARRWDAQCALDEAVAAVRAGDVERAGAFAESLANRSVAAGLLALMMGTRQPGMLRYVEERVAREPALVHERYGGRTLLHAASAHGNPAMVELLVRLGADPDAQDGGSHTPLYSLANEYRGSGGEEVVRVLAQSGANVNAGEGAKRCTALHMAARRGGVEIAAALLDCGADIEARDRVGDTALRRAVNCGKVDVAALLLERGADAHAVGSRGLTPAMAARTPAMQELLERVRYR